MGISILSKGYENKSERMREERVRKLFRVWVPLPSDICLQLHSAASINHLIFSLGPLVRCGIDASAKWNYFCGLAQTYFPEYINIKNIVA